MPFQKGNKLGAKARRFEAAVNRYCTQEDWARLNKCAQKLLDLAADGEKWAVEMLRDTLDGKPAQELTGTLNHEHTHSSEPVSDSVAWLDGALRGEPAGKAKEPLPH